jgi:hypothetical protein
MLSEAKHLANERNLRFLSYAAIGLVVLGFIVLSMSP